jgi:hypothetical protein
VLAKIPNIEIATTSSFRVKPFFCFSVLMFIC